MPVVAMPDGTRVSFPDSMSPDQIRSLIAQKFPHDPHVQSAQQSTDAGGALGGVYAAAHGLEDMATFGLGDKAIAGLSSLVNGKGYGENLQNIKDNAAAAAQAHPILNIAGDVGGAVAGGGALEHAAGAVLSRVAPGAINAARASLALQKGQTIRNTGRLAATGAASGGLYGAVASGAQSAEQGDDAGTAALKTAEGGGAGAIGGAVLGPVGGVAAKAVSSVARGFSDTGTKAIAALAKKLNVSPNDLQAAYHQYAADAGHPPSLAEIVDLRDRGEIQNLARRNPVVGAAVEQARAKAAGELPTQLSQKVASTVGHPQDLADLVTARDAAATAAMDPIRGQHIGLSPDEADFMRGDITTHMGIKGPVRREIADQLANGTLSLGNADTIRKNLSAQARAKPGEGYDQLANEFNQVVRSASPEYGAMLDQYAAHSRYIDAFQHGQTGKTVGQTSDPALIAALQAPEGQAGYQAGLATRLHDQAFKSESGAVHTASDLSQNAATSANAAKTFGAKTMAPLSDAARAKSQGLENLSVIAGSGTPQPQNDRASLTHLGLAAMGTLKGRIYHAVQAASGGIRLSDAVQRKIGDMLTDPRQSQQAINYLRAQGVRDHNLRVLMTQVAKSTARPAGAAGAYLQGQLQ